VSVIIWGRCVVLVGRSVWTSVNLCPRWLELLRLCDKTPRLNSKVCRELTDSMNDKWDYFLINLKKLTGKHHFPPSRIFNTDETGVFCFHLSVARVLTEKGIDQVEKLTPGERGRKSLAISLFPCLYFQGSNWIKKDALERSWSTLNQTDGSPVKGSWNGWRSFLEESALLSPIQWCWVMTATQTTRLSTWSFLLDRIKCRC